MAFMPFLSCKKISRSQEMFKNSVTVFRGKSSRIIQYGLCNQIDFNQNELYDNCNGQKMLKKEEYDWQQKE